MLEPTEVTQMLGMMSVSGMGHPTELSYPAAVKGETVMHLQALNKLIRQHTALDGMIHLVKSAKRHGYSPSLATNNHYGDGEELTIIADYFDAMMQRMGLNNRAYRW